MRVGEGRHVTQDSFAQMVGFAASIIAFVLFAPQACHTWRVRNIPIALAGVSTGTQWLLLCNAVLWGVYAVLTGAFWVGAPGLVNGPLAVVTLALIYRGRAIPEAPPAVPDCEFCAEGVEHRVFITSPPGWGSVMGCSAATRPHGVIVNTPEEIARLRAERIPR